ncbi:efflux RND transporter permease subunit [Stieleria sp. TO1_6]|uniref:efflux RND transporter permease subunit n=1 Tax=Stieleria tagensis TaxID=2956795 RepID=UPI00209B2F1F|nr:efflux RND transporter permease subunit [Stieleria tagensis]MCO8121085.1 efflux RND transporter permease subunit [Stieleria tagensis]
MNLIQAMIQNPIKVAVGVLLVTLFGIVALLRMPMQLTPEVQTPTITVTTRWPGASPQEVEQEIIVEQEEQLKSVEGITKMSSESADSQGTITLEFLVGTNMEEALLKVNSRLQQVPEYPEDADQPIITTANSSDSPIAWFILSARMPTNEAINEFADSHPQLADELGPVLNASNVGVAMLRLRMLAKDHPEVKQLLPPESLDVTKLRRFCEDEIEARFERVSGVSQSNVIGGLEQEVQVVVDPQRLASRQLTLTTVRQALRGQNADTSAGDFWEGKRRMVVRTLGQFRSTEQVENQLLDVQNGAPIFIRDVAEVRLGYKKADGLVRRFGESSVAINCLRETGANVLDVMQGLQEVAKELDEGLLKSRGMQLTQVYDETEYIYSSIDLVQQNIFIGGALTMTVLMLFLHLSVRTLVAIPFILASAIAAAYVSPWFFVVCLALLLIVGFWFARGALVVGLAIPTSIIGTFLVLGILGRSLNVISLAGLAFAVGMLVDNAVVVLENIYQHAARGKNAFQAAAAATSEVLGAVVASTLTTVAVFLPVVFVQEESGQLFRDIALAISASVALSLLVSMTLIPTLSARLYRNPDRDASPPHHGKLRTSLNRFGNWIERSIEGFGKRFVSLIVGINAWLQRGVLRRLVVVVGMTLMAGLLSYQFWPKVEYLPSGNRNLVFGILLPPPGYNLDKLMTMGEQVERDLRPYWDVDPDSEEAKDLKYPVIQDFFFVARGRQVFMGLRAVDETRASELVPLVQEVGSRLYTTFAVAKQSSLFEQGLTAGRTIDVEITGPDLQKLVQMGGQVLGQVMGMMPTAQARPVPSLDLSSPEIHITPKPLQAAAMGVSNSDLGFLTNALIDGAYVGDYFLDGKKIDLSLRGEDQYATSTADLKALPIATPEGRLIPLAAVADVQNRSGPEQINHRERVRSITIEVSPPPEIALEDAMAQINAEILEPMRAKGQLEGGYQVNLAGTADKLRDTWNALRMNIALALLITYLLMAALFESWLYPLVIIFSVPLGAVGGILALSVLNLFIIQSLDVLTMLGFVILIGTVVNNPILIVHQSLTHMREDAMGVGEATLQSVRSRIRPIFMTTTTTVLGLMPLVLFPGAGSELYRGLGSVVLGGLLISTIFTVVFVPSLFTLALQTRHWIRQRLFGKDDQWTEDHASTPTTEPTNTQPELIEA